MQPHPGKNSSPGRRRVPWKSVGNLPLTTWPALGGKGETQGSEASLGPGHSPVQAPQKVTAGFPPNKLPIPSLYHASNDKLAVLRQYQPEECPGEAGRRWEAAWYGGKAKFSRPDVLFRPHISLTAPRGSLTSQPFCSSRKYG